MAIVREETGTEPGRWHLVRFVRRRGRREIVRRWIVLALTAVVLLFLGLNAPSAISDTTAAFAHPDGARLPWLGVAVLAEACSIACFAGVQSTLLRSGQVVLGRRGVAGLSVASVGASVLLPGGVWSASGWLATQYHRRGVAVPLVVWTLLATGFCASITVLGLLLVGAGAADVGDQDLLLVAGLVLVAATVLLVVASHRVGWVERWLRRRRGRIASPANRLAGELGAVAGWRTGVRGGTAVLVYSAGNWLADAVCLAAAFGVVAQPVPWRTILFAYATSQIAGTVVPLPAGIGGVEGGMAGAFALAGTPVGPTLPAVLVYRVLGTWLVAVVGLLTLLAMTHASARPATTPPEGDTAPPDPSA